MDSTIVFLLFLLVLIIFPIIVNFQVNKKKKDNLKAKHENDNDASNVAEPKEPSSDSKDAKPSLRKVTNPQLLYAVGMKAFSEQQYNDAVRYFMDAGTRGSTEAINMLGVCYENGYGVPVMRDLAIKYYTLSAEAGDPDAQFNLGRLYYMIGNEKYRSKIGGVWVDAWPEPIEPYEEDVLAEKWLRAAAEQGSPKAQFGMGELLMNGIGVKRSTKTYEEGKEWMKKAASSGFMPAINYLKAKKL